MSQTNLNHLRNLSNNEANRITRESICTALLELLKTNEFKKISISELVRKAGVSRQSFYRNYNTKEDIVLEIERTIAAHMIIVIQWIAPQLPVLREIIRLHAGHALGIEVAVDLEAARVLPHVAAAGRHIDRDVAEEGKLLLFRVFPERGPLPVE